MNTFTQYREIIQHELLQLQKEIQPPPLKEQINYFLSLGGKRLRPSLLLAGCDLFDSDLALAIKPALGIELFHNFTLMHDDVMDAAPLRRNKETVHKKWNESTAILAGDAMYASSFSLISMVNENILKRVVNLFCETALQVCEGQQLDMLYENNHSVTVSDYLHMIEMKTAVLLACALKIGAMIGGANEKETVQLYNFGINIGMAFQLQDDILDVYGDQEKFGKQIGGDIVSGKKTFLLIKAIELSDEKAKSKILKKNKTNDDVRDVVAIYDQLEIKNRATLEVESRYNKAIESLDCLSINKNKLDQLNEFAQSMLIREN